MDAIMRDSEIEEMPTRRRSSDSSITEKTSVQLGVICGIGGFIVAAIWWASSMQTKMDIVLEKIRTSEIVAVRQQELDTHVKVLESRILALEARKQ